MRQFPLVILVMLFPFLIQASEMVYSFHSDSSQIINIRRWETKTDTDSVWQILSDSLPTRSSTIQWYRAKIELQGQPNEYEHLALKISNFASAYEIYWDDVLILTNGTVGSNPDAEVPGVIRQLVKLKLSATQPGMHFLTIRWSTHHLASRDRQPWVNLGYFSLFQNNLTTYFYSLLFDTGFFFLAMLFSIALFWGGERHRSYMFFAVFSLINVLTAVISFYVNHVAVNVIHFPFIRSVIFIMIPLAVNSLNLFFLINFHIPKKWYFFAGSVGLTLLILLLFETEYALYIPLYSAGLLIYAIRRREPGSFIAFIGLVGLMLGTFIDYQHVWSYSYLIGEAGFLFCLTLSISRQIKVQNQAHAAASLRSARLEAELLKKNIQPHFLMNTLLSIMSWIEENPRVASELIQSLADEFRMINHISAEREIPLEAEIQLCQAHLKLMGIRMDAQYQLLLENIPTDESIPPMVFHTLIENGLTHAYQSGENGTFVLAYERTNGKRHYRLRNDGSLLSEKMNTSSEGVGLAYVRARLEENYPQKWEMKYGLHTNQWQVDILIQR